MFLLHIKKILRNKGLALLLLGYISGIIYLFLIRKANLDFGAPYPQIGLLYMIRALPYMFMIIMFISYEMFSSLNKTDTMELVSNRRISLRAQKYDLAILLSVVIFSGITVWSFLRKHTGISGHEVTELDRYFGRVVFIFIILPGIIAIMAGLCSSAFKNRTIGVCLLAVIFYIFDKSFHQLIIGMSFENDGFFKLGTLFTIFDTEDSRSVVNDAFYLMSAENVHIFRGMFWICLMSSIVAWVCRRKIPAALCTGFTIFFLIAFFLPSGAVYNLELFNAFDRWMEPNQYYMENAAMIEEKYLKGEEKTDFSILSYNIEISVMKDILEVQAELVPDNGSLGEYKFTLYHRYKVKSVHDQDGRELDFEQTDDYLRVIPKGKEIKKFVFSYKGFSQHFYATTQGICLPFHFEYYPAAGWQKVYLYDRSNHCFTQELPSIHADFELKITYPKILKLYTNLDLMEESSGLWKRTAVYGGNTDGLSIFASPSLRDTYIKGIRVVYSDLDWDCSPYSRNHMEGYEELFEKGIFPEGTIYFAVPWDTYNVCFGEKQVVEKEPGRTEDDYEKFRSQGNTYYIPTAEDEEEMQKSMDMLD